MTGNRLLNHEHQIRWKVDRTQLDPDGSHVWIDFWFDCGCGIGTSAVNDINRFAGHMRFQRGWDVDTTCDWYYWGGAYSVCVRRQSLEPT